MPIRLIAVDLDGTLLDSHWQVPEANRRAIERAIERGIHIVLVTGRRFSFTHSVTEQLHDDIALIVNNGALIKSPEGATLLRRLLPDDAETAGLLALMLLTDARRAARSRPDGTLVPLAEQDRGQWDRERIAEGVGLVSGALARGEVGQYQLQAAIAAVHDEAASMADTDWPQILALYDLLVRGAPNPMTALNRAVAVGEVHGAAAGLAELAEVEADPRLKDHHRLLATRAHLQELAGDHAAAAASYQRAAARSTSRPERQLLARQAARLYAPGRVSS